MINFITLTISSKKNIGIAEGYENLLKPFLRKLRKGNFSYIWKAEYQKRGQLHYHLTTNQFHNWQDIRNTWNKLQKENGYLQEFGEQYGHFNANSTDVHAVYKVRNIGAYLAKYMSKIQTPPPDAIIEKGKIWDCSKDLKKKRFSTVEEAENVVKIWTAENNKTAESIYLDRCKIIKVKTPTDLLTDAQKIDYKNWLK